MSQLAGKSPFDSKHMLVDFEQEDSFPELGDSEFLAQLSKLNQESKHSLISRLDELVSRQAFKPSARAVNACLFVDLLFEQLHSRKELPRCFFNRFQTLKIPLVKYCLLDPEFTTDPNHWVRKLLAQLIQQFTGYGKSIPEAKEPLWEALNAVLHSLTHISGDEQHNHAMQSAIQQLDDEFSLCEGKSQKLKTKQKQIFSDQKYQRQVDEFLDQLSYQKKFPPVIAKFFRNTWRPTLHYYRSETKFNPNTWEKLSSFTQDLFDTYHLNGEAKNDLIISSLRANLEHYLFIPEKSKRLIIDQTLKALDEVLKPKPPSGVSLGAFLRKNRFRHLNFSSSIINTVSKLTIGQWVLFYDEQKNEQRLQLLHKFNDSQEILLASLMGNDSQIVSCQELAYRLMSKQAALLLSNGLFENAWRTAMEQINERLSQSISLKRADEINELKALKKHHEELEKQHLELSQQKAKLAQENSNLKKTIEDHLSTIEKQQRNIHKLEASLLEEKQGKNQMEIEFLKQIDHLQRSQDDSEKRRKAELEVLLRVKADLASELERINTENHRHEINEIVKSLSIGSWISLIDESGLSTPCKIAIIYASSGKHVLVDGKGITKAEFMAEEIVELVLSGKATILKQEERFDESMESLIKSLK